MQLRLLLLGLLMLAVIAAAQEIAPTNPQEVSTQSQILNLQPSATHAGGSGLFRLQTVPCNPMGTLAISGQGLLVRHQVFDIGHETVATGMLSLTYSLTRDISSIFQALTMLERTPSRPDSRLRRPSRGSAARRLASSTVSRPSATACSRSAARRVLFWGRPKRR